MVCGCGLYLYVNMKTSHYKTTQQFIDRYYIGIDTSVISPDIDNLIK
jgi:hypothetical protein